MKNIFRFLLITGITVSAILLNACVKDENKDSYGLSKVTTFPEVYLVDEGETIIVLEGSQYVEPGYSAVIGEDDVTSEVVITGSVNVNVEGMYYLTYTSSNTEGYSQSKTRRVFVAEETPNPTTDNLTGSYTSSVSRNSSGTIANRGPYTQSLSGKYGFYFIQDLLGGWYWIGSSYGLDYAYDGVVFIDADGVVTLRWADDQVGWGDGAIFVGTGAYDAQTGTITFSAQMGSVSTMTFNVTLVKR